MKNSLITVLLFICALTHSQVIDGDTFKRNGVVIRIAEIDCPEISQSGGKEAKRYLEQCIAYRDIRWEVLKKDKYGRLICRVFAGNSNVAYLLVASGNATVYRRYSNNPVLIAAENLARKKRMGIWKNGENIITPEQWRHRK